MWKIIRTLLIAVVLLGIGCYIFINYTQQLPADADPDAKLKDLLFTMLGVVFIIVGAGFLLWPLAGTIGYYFESLFWAKGDAAKSPPMYKLAAWLAEQGRYGEALAEYQKITKRDKKATIAYEGQIYVLAYAMGNTPAAEKLWRTARKKVPADDLPHLDWFYEQLLAGNEEVCARPPHPDEEFGEA